jgi:hypothetical protein
LAAGLSFLFSIYLWFGGDPAVGKQQGMFVGLWVPSILSLGTLLKDGILLKE